jgi:hypothetical protein
MGSASELEGMARVCMVWSPAVCGALEVGGIPLANARSIVNIAAA